MKAPSVENISMWNETVYNLESNSMQLFNEITEMLRNVKPMRSYNDYVRIWVPEERGTISDMQFGDLEDAMDYFEVDNEENLNNAFLNQYPDEKYWFMIESMYNEDGRILRLRHFTICIYNEMPEHIDKTEHDYLSYLQWVKDALSKLHSIVNMSFQIKM